ncbi:MAG: hypothetical protein DSZ10_03535 [Sulfurovum sp.]|nr:MAG: hypothetical protein DSZ10_03535 [Sulfurovum sp.]
MLNMERVITEIQSVGLYDLVLQDVQNITGKEKPSREEVAKVLKTHPQVLRDYMQTNVEYNLSNIHLKDIDFETLDEACRQKAKRINDNLMLLRDIEKFTLDFEQSSTLVFIFSVEFFVLFSVQYFIVLLDLKAWQWWIYGLFALSIAVAYWYAKKVQKRYKVNKAHYEKVYEETLALIDILEKEACLKKADLYIEASDEHI